MWAKSTYRQGNTKRVWHRVTVCAWDSNKYQSQCYSGGHILQKRQSEQRTDPPLTDLCPKCEGGRR